MKKKEQTVGLEKAIEVLQFVDTDEVHFNREGGLSNEYCDGFRYAIKVLKEINEGKRFTPYDKR
jgi:hypothetical protein